MTRLNLRLMSRIVTAGIAQVDYLVERTQN